MRLERHKWDHPIHKILSQFHHLNPLINGPHKFNNVNIHKFILFRSQFVIKRFTLYDAKNIILWNVLAQYISAHESMTWVTNYHSSPAIIFNICCSFCEICNKCVGLWLPKLSWSQCGYKYNADPIKIINIWWVASWLPN